MTAEQEQALRDAGSFVESLPPAMERASTKTVLMYLDIVRTSLTTKEAGDRLRVSEGRIRMSPVEWLSTGRSPSELADLVDDTFAPVCM
ncbi:hypothetical protein TPB0596_42250 [Tsukamurella pulmonis]|uniref:hypothetical protein n=1 Tax=Tsukamurella pulmonis TaxID=47312 RepID=UPI001EDD2DE9|nr:hypothetical protein [Tsukamurella pulmonis]BDD84462.1 hypothetical protein TPB0596_42250 [Tsukamurella pulmonis]